jgi:hypothetical protein
MMDSLYIVDFGSTTMQAIQCMWNPQEDRKRTVTQAQRVVDMTGASGGSLWQSLYRQLTNKVVDEDEQYDSRSRMRANLKQSPNPMS